MSAFDDEFGLFSEESPREDDERRPTLGARRIASSETIIDDVELEEGGPPRRRGDRGGERQQRGRRIRRSAPDPATSGRRAAELLYFLAQKLVSNPDAIAVQTVPGDRGPVLELEVDQEDIGKVVGRGGRVAQALRTLVRASAEGKVGVEIIEVEDVDDEADGEEAAVATEVTDS
ncbi:MAG: KH domain-containing protein [Candidatus Eremiobacteraeota bacterium]|nr:KH domain-containing protein [Candidatus Eremiobacteraeota bacterium]